MIIKMKGRVDEFDLKLLELITKDSGKIMNLTEWFNIKQPILKKKRKHENQRNMDIKN